LRDIEICLKSLKAKLYHVGIRGKAAASKSTFIIAGHLT
jgi:hypothetical protein